MHSTENLTCHYDSSQKVWLFILQCTCSYSYIRVYVPFEDLDYIALVSVHSHQLLPGHHYLGSHSESLQYMDIEKYSVISCKANTKLHTHDKNNLHLR